MPEHRITGQYRNRTSLIWDPHPQYLIDAFGLHLHLILYEDSNFIPRHIKVSSYPLLTHIFVSHQTQLVSSSDYTRLAEWNATKARRSQGSWAAAWMLLSRTHSYRWSISGRCFVMRWHGKCMKQLCKQTSQSEGIKNDNQMLEINRNKQLSEPHVYTKNYKWLNCHLNMCFETHLIVLISKVHVHSQHNEQKVFICMLTPKLLVRPVS